MLYMMHSIGQKNGHGVTAATFFWGAVRGDFIGEARLKMCAAETISFEKK